MDKDSESDGSPDISKSWVMVDVVEDIKDDEFKTPDSTGADSTGTEDIPENQQDSDTDISIISSITSECGNSYNSKSDEDEEFSQPMLFQCDGACDDSEDTTTGNVENVNSSFSECTSSTAEKDTTREEEFVDENIILSLMDSKSAVEKQIIEAIFKDIAKEPLPTETYVLPNFSRLNLTINVTSIAIALTGILMGLFLTTYLNGQLVPHSNIDTNVLNSHQGDRLIDLSNNKHYQENSDQRLQIIEQVDDTEIESVDFDITVSENPSQIETQIETGNKKQTDGRQDLKKIDELRAKEEYLNEKEKFLIMKEHQLVRKEIKIKKRRADVESCNYQRKKDDEKDRFKKEQAEQEFEVGNDSNKNQEHGSGVEVDDQQPRVEDLQLPDHENSIIHTKTDKRTKETDERIFKQKIKKDKYKKYSDSVENRETFKQDKKKKMLSKSGEFEQKSDKDKFEDEHKKKKHNKQERKKHQKQKTHHGKVILGRDSSKETIEEPFSKETSQPNEMKWSKLKKNEFKAQQTINNDYNKFVHKKGKYGNTPKKLKNLYTEGFQPNKKEKFPKRNVTGKWYQILHEGRDNIRKKEHISDWLFERAHLRSILRDKAHWYFQWMNDRENRRLGK